MIGEVFARSINAACLFDELHGEYALFSIKTYIIALYCRVIWMPAANGTCSSSSRSSSSRSSTSRQSLTTSASSPIIQDTSD
mmetsp:Transcript_5087/g.7841  ORF Transcript_5087/g.7841 Transcript_5087/m.7841 type:complete len:82 (-) Transcript_5087:655-900(-)